jgi:transcriptional regulator with XRE-family HTH domain
MSVLKVRLKKEALLAWGARQNFSNRQIAHALGYDSGQFSNWLKGVRYVSPNARQKIQSITNLEWDELFEMEECGGPEEK